MDQYSRRVLAWTLTRRRTARVTCAVLTRAARTRAAHGLIFHSDRGSEYMGAPFCAHVARLGFLQSASVRGPGDNSHMESFFHSLKAELTRGVAFPSDRALHRALRSYIRYYNAARLHSALDYVSPLHSSAKPRKPSLSTKVVQDPERSADCARLRRALLFSSFAA